MKECCPRWANIGIDNKGKYLGFMVGPGSKEERWKKPIAKFESRVSYWAGLRLGMAMNAVEFNIYDRVRSVMSWAMRACIRPGQLGNAEGFGKSHALRLRS